MSPSTTAVHSCQQRLYYTVASGEIVSSNWSWTYTCYLAKIDTPVLGFKKRLLARLCPLPKSNIFKIEPDFEL
jgi:hypothetical protein